MAFYKVLIVAHIAQAGDLPSPVVVVVVVVRHPHSLEEEVEALVVAVVVEVGNLGVRIKQHLP
jgi:hypothetical protein